MFGIDHDGTPGLTGAKLTPDVQFENLCLVWDKFQSASVVRHSAAEVMLGYCEGITTYNNEVPMSEPACNFNTSFFHFEVDHTRRPAVTAKQLISHNASAHTV